MFSALSESLLCVSQNAKRLLCVGFLSPNLSAFPDVLQCEQIKSFFPPLKHSIKHSGEPIIGLELYELKQVGVSNQ